MSEATPLKLLVIDDSMLFRTVLTRTLSADPDVGQVTAASSGEAGLAQIRRERPDAVILDVVMPGMGGLEVLRTIRRTDPLLPVIMFSTETGASAKITIEALTRGASDCVLKPATGTQDTIKQHLLPRLKALARAASRRSATRSRGAATAASGPTHRRPAPIPVSVPASVRIVAIGSSTGGPAALDKLLRQLPANFPVPIVIVQHMPPTFTGYLAQQLNAGCKLSVREGVDGARPAPGEVWIAPGGRHMEVVRGGVFGMLRLHDGPPVNACRPAVDVLFRSAVATFGRGVLAAVLTGMGTDGADGAVAIKQAGGRVIAQDEDSSVVWGMPRAVAKAGAASLVLPLNEIAAALRQGVTATHRRAAS